jgi:hypothetical protein
VENLVLLSLEAGKLLRCGDYLHRERKNRKLALENLEN